MAEEVISTIRTAQAFGTQNILGTLYDGHIQLAHKADMKGAAWHGGGLAVFFFIIYSAYALGAFPSMPHLRSETDFCYSFQLWYHAHKWRPW